MNWVISLVKNIQQMVISKIDTDQFVFELLLTFLIGPSSFDPNY